MHYLRLFVPTLLGILVLSGCTTVINADLKTGASQLSVDGWLTDQPGVQTIRLTQTSAYFDSSTPPAADGATVTVTDNRGRTYSFTDPDKDSYYTWTPTTRDTLGVIGRSYTLTIQYQGQTYQANTRMNRVPPVDSLVFRKASESKTRPASSSQKNNYLAEFYARDIPGATDYYRVKFYQNGTLINTPNSLILVYDGAQNSSFNTDGLAFLQFIRQSINPTDYYVVNDNVRVEILSITADAFDYLTQLKTQVTNGGLFASPPANVPTNIINTKEGGSGPKATGFFVASAIRSRSASVTEANMR